MRSLAWLVLAFSGIASCSNGDRGRQVVHLASSVAIPAEQWVEITAPEPLRTASYHHDVCFGVAIPYRLADQPMGIVDRSGDPVAFKVEVVGDGVWVALPLLSYSDDDVCFGTTDEHAAQAFTHVRFYASASMTIDHVLWRSTDK